MCLPDVSTRILVVFITWWVQSREADLNQEKGYNMAHRHPSIDSLIYCSSDSGFNERSTDSTDNNRNSIQTNMFHPLSPEKSSIHHPTHSLISPIPSSPPGEYWTEELNVEEMEEDLGTLNASPQPEFLAKIHGELENVTDYNEDLEHVIKRAEEILNRGLDIPIKNFKSTLHKELAKTQEEARKSRKEIKIQARSYLSSIEAEEVTNNPIITDNIHLITKAKEYLGLFDREIEKRGLDLEKTDEQDRLIEWPRFSGTTLPLLQDFLDDIECLCTKVGLPLSHRGRKLFECIQNPAKDFVTKRLEERNPSFDDIRHILETKYQDPEVITMLLCNVHEDAGRMSIEDEPMLMLQKAKRHNQALQAMKRMKNRWKNSNEEVGYLTNRYCNSVQEMLPVQHKQKLCEIGWPNIDPETKFQEITTILTNLHRFSTTLISVNPISSNNNLPFFNPRIPPPPFFNGVSRI